jgi:DNA-binding NarL/FixJ family response regulator
MTLRILIADDHQDVRKGVCSILEDRTDLEICAEAENGEDAVHKAVKVNPHLVILDVAMPVMDGFTAAKKIKQLLPQVPILMLSMHDGPQMIRSAQLAGAQGFVTKSEAEKTLLKAVDALLAGKTFFVPESVADYF